MATKDTLKIKIVIIGDLGVGKTTMVEKLLSVARPRHCEQRKVRWEHMIVVDRLGVCLNIWDTSGESFVVNFLHLIL